MNGIMPNMENTTQTSAVSRNPSRLAIADEAGFIQNVINAPVPRVTAMVIANAQMSDSL